MPALHDQEGQEPLYMRHRDQQGGQEKHAIETKRLLSVVVFIFKTTFFTSKLSQICLIYCFEPKKLLRKVISAIVFEADSKYLVYRPHFN
jgi:hypothetical protein